jgi:hypothetical protein
VANRAKAKGTSFESAVVTYLAGRGLDARRIVLHGNKDEGDIDTGAGWNLEAKNVRTMALGQWVGEADVESVNAGRPVAVVAKRVGKGDPGEAYVVMPLRVFVSSVLGYDGTSDEEASAQ